MTVRINLWSGPRNVSTALMYSFAQRSDTVVVDEPLYGHYLRVTGADHPGARDVMASMATDGHRVVEDLILGPCEQPILFLKQMAHHLVDIEWEFTNRTENVFLVRDPEQMLPSLARTLTEPRLRDTGLATQVQLYDYLLGNGQNPPVLDARQVLLDPSGVLSQLCERIGIPYNDAMMAWPAGARPEDGVWAKHWYHAVHESTGFRPYHETTEPFPKNLMPLLEECLPFY